MKNKMSINELYDHLISEETQKKLSDVLREAKERGMTEETEKRILEDQKMLYVPHGRDA